MTFIHEAFKQVNSFGSKLFAGYGAFTSRHPFFVLIVGLAAFIAVSFGNFSAEVNKDIDDLWVEKGTRLREERDFWNAYWGGLIRKTQIAITPSSGVISKTDLDAMKDSLTPLLVLNTSQTSNPKEIKLQSFIGSGVQTEYRASDMCESPPVPSLLKPYSFTQGAASANGLWSYAFSRYVNCVGSVTSDSAMNLPNGTGVAWGIDRFGCNRATVLDCFREGNFDYPDNLKLLDNVAFKVAETTKVWANQTSLIPAYNNLAIRTAISSCLSVVTPYVTVNAFTSSVAPLLISFGYWWRKSYASMTPEDINTHLQQAFANGQNASITVQGCIQGGGLPCCLNYAGRKVPEQNFAGKLIYASNTTNGSIGTIRTVANFYNQDNPFWYIDVLQNIKNVNIKSSDDRLSLVKAYEQLQIDFYLKYYNREAGTNFASGEPYAASTFDFSCWRSTDDVVDEGSKVEGGLVVGAYLLLIGYSVFTFAKVSHPCSVGHVVYSRLLLGLWGVFTVAIAVVAGFGFTALIGIKFSPISINLVPFIALGVGVVDMYVVATRVISLSDVEDVTTRMKQTMSAAGPAVFLTTATNAAAFFISSITPIPAVQTFVIQLGITTILNLIALFMLFLPVVYFDLSRTKAKRLDLWINPAWCSGTNIPAESDPKFRETGDFITNFTEKYLAKLLQVPVVKVIVMVAFWAWFLGLAYNGFVNTESGLRLSDIALRGTYIRSFTELAETYYGGYDNFIITRQVNYSEPATQQEILDTINNLQASSWLTDSHRVRDTSWLVSLLGLSPTIAPNLASYFATLNTSINPTNPPPAPNSSSPIPLTAEVISALDFGVGSRTSFDLFFEAFIGGLGALSAENVICLRRDDNTRVPCNSFDTRIHTVGPSRQLFFARNLYKHQNFIDALKDTRARTDSASNGHSFVYGYIYQFWEQYLNIETNLYKIVGWSLLGVFIATLLFQFSIISSIIVVAVVLKSVIELYGFMFLIGVKVNAFSVVNVCIAVGLGIEFTAYYARDFTITAGDRNTRMATSLVRMMKPMLHGCVANLLSVVVLAGARFPFFRYYYFGMFFAMIIIAFVNGLIFLPVVLSLIGPATLHPDGDGEAEKKETSAQEPVNMKRLQTEPAIPKDTI